MSGPDKLNAVSYLSGQDTYIWAKVSGPDESVTECLSQINRTEKPASGVFEKIRNFAFKKLLHNNCTFLGSLKTKFTRQI